MLQQVIRQFVKRHLVAGLCALSLTCAPAWAQSADAKNEQAAASKNALKTKDDPLMIGKRDINKGQLNFYSLEREIALGRQLAFDIDREARLVTDPLVNEFVNRIAQNIVLHSDAKVPFTVKVIDDEVVNAFALPGGFLYVYRGLIEAAENEAEVAGVMAHEIAHVTARHGVEQATKGEFINYASIPLIFLGGIGGYIIQQAAGIAIPLGFLKFSRGAEKEADRLGAQYMWASGYDPNALVTFFEKLQAREKRKPGTLEKIFSTHPMTGDRITEVQKLVAKFPERNEYALSTSEFTNLKARMTAAAAATRTASAGGDDQRPTLRRRPAGSGDPADQSDDNTDRPTLKRGGGNARSTGDPAEDPLKNEDRVELKRGSGKDIPVTTPKSTTATPSQAPAPSQTSDDRPVLKRREGSASEETKPGTTPAASPSTTPTVKPATDAPATGSTAAPAAGNADDRPVLKRRPGSGN